MSNWLMDKQNIYTMKYYSVMRRKKTTDIDGPQKPVKARKLDTNGCILYNSMYIKYSEKASPYIVVS